MRRWSRPQVAEVGRVVAVVAAVAGQVAEVPVRGRAGRRFPAVLVLEQAVSGRDRGG